MAKWQPATVIVAVVDRLEDVDRSDAAYWVGYPGYIRDIWGLHKAPWGPFGQIDWIVTHLPTGRRASAFSNRRAAEQFVRQIEGHPGWDEVAGKIAGTELHDLVIQATDNVIASRHREDAR